MIKLGTEFKMISIIITSYKESATIGKAIESFLQQDIKDAYELIIATPDIETLNIVKKYASKYKQIKIFQDQGKGKSTALNLLLPKIKGRIIILSDGDVFVSKNSVNEILKQFEDTKTGCVSGKPVPQNSRNNLFSYWAHLLCYAAHKLREKRSKQDKFLECSGYLWAFRNFIIKKFPKDIGEDTIVPILFWLKNFEIKYAEKAEVYVKFPNNLKDFLKQKRRAVGAHDNIGKYINPRKIPRMKTFFNEVLESYELFFYPKNSKEFFFTFLLFPLRLYVWLNLFYNSKIRKRKYTDAWKRVESTK